MKRFLLLSMICALFMPLAMQAQEDGGFTVSTDMVSRYVWRGTAFSTAPALQPTFEFSKGGFAIGAWGSYSFLGFDGAEADIYLSYTTLEDKLTLTFTDYFFPDEVNGTFNNYFEYDGDITGHVFEGAISWNGTESLPLTFLAAVNFFGADAKLIEDDTASADFNTVVGNQMSMYFELGYGVTCKDETELEFFLGFTPNEPRKADATTGYIGEAGFYGYTMGVVNLGVTASKEIKITENFSIPVFSQLVFNPMAEDVFLVFGLSL
ncbi:MAG: hypothetical protein C0592_13585 [Marinilabiliales bacterium]|nr:MAG: hypothetical protein C0592_13585 [Marinilabiliales bacterium]